MLFRLGLCSGLLVGVQAWLRFSSGLAFNVQVVFSSGHVQSMFRFGRWHSGGAQVALRFGCCSAPYVQVWLRLCADYVQMLAFVFRWCGGCVQVVFRFGCCRYTLCAG